VFCLKCGTELPSNANFCLQCGEPLTSSDYTTRVSPSPHVTLPQAQQKSQFIITPGYAIGIAFFALLLGIVAIVISERYRQQSGNSREVATAPTPNSTPEVASTPTPKATPRPTLEPVIESTPEPTPRPSQQLIPNSFTVSPGQYYSVQFHVRGRNHVSGWYRSDSNIIALIVDEDGLARVEKGGRGDGGKVFYSSGGKVARGEIDVYLPTGTYYIVFSNQYSIISTKYINANIVIE
jgi:hypothetical protein